MVGSVVHMPMVKVDPVRMLVLDGLVGMQMAVARRHGRVVPVSVVAVVVPVGVLVLLRRMAVPMGMALGGV